MVGRSQQQSAEIIGFFLVCFFSRIEVKMKKTESFIQPMLGIITVLTLLNSHIHRGGQLNEETLKNSTQPNNKLSLVCDCCYKTRRRRRCKRSVLMMALQSVSQCASSASASSESLQP
ncbi:hypothetical protein D917_09993, partial [Trichinella nativa]